MVPATSSVKSPELRAIVVPSMLILSMSMPASAVILPVDTRVEPLVKAPVTARVPPTARLPASSRSSSSQGV